MIFENKPGIDEDVFIHRLGYGDALPDEAAAKRIAGALAEVERAASPRWVYKVFEVVRSHARGHAVSLEPGGPGLAGRDIERHLEGCTGAAVFALTLGAGMDAHLRRLSAADPFDAVVADTAASELAECYADEAERLIKERLAGEGPGGSGVYLTGRYSPGYGDLDLSVQNKLVRALDGARAIGLTVTDSHIMLPRKSITAIIGVSDHPVTGARAGCESCALWEKCEKRKTGEACE
ncbi:MAG: methionine synthase [Clostridiales Family XIII bacterium]|jgi:hypothetical protein|nr:methionine synthase [Clostridiales Family XIII bacterium]